METLSTDLTLDDTKVLKYMHTPAIARQFAVLMLLFLFITLLILVYMPWQQNVYGSGEVIAYSPLERSQEIEAPINGRVMKWYVQEGSRVKKGELIAEMADNDPDYTLRLQQQRQTLQQQLELAQSKAFAYELRVQDYEVVLTATRDGAQAKIVSAQAKLQAAQQELEADQAALKANQLNLERETTLQAKGLSSQRTLELAEFSYQKSVADVQKDRAKVNEANSEILVARAELQKSQSSAQATINSSEAVLAEARSSVEKSRAELIKLDTQLARQANQSIRAPRDGTILKLNTFSDTVYAKAGDKLAVLVPDTEQRAVELYMKGNDIPLIRPGREVRLQFEGWPALQFSGWPSIAVGTFSGTVVLVDATDDGKDKFRIVVRPRTEDHWPEKIYLRQGVKSRGWVMLDTVSLGFELWRQFNSFPPMLRDQMPKTDQNVVKRKSKK